MTTAITNYKTADGQAAVMAMYDAALARWPVPYTTKTVPTRHGDTFVIASGAPGAPALVLLHGACSNALAWMGDVADYIRNFRVYAVDLPGEPGKSTPNRPSFRGLAYAEWMSDLLDSLQVQCAAIIGISQGGWTALRFATCHPERVDKLVLLAPGGVSPTKLSFIVRGIPLTLCGKPGAEMINRITFGGQPIAKEAVAFMNTIMANFKPRFDAAPQMTDAELHRLKMPVMLLVGAKDALYDSTKTAARLEANAPAICVELLSEDGHVLHNTAGKILPFLIAK